MDQSLTQITAPYLTVNGAAEAIEFYKRAFGAVETGRMPFEDGKRLMHASISVNGGCVMMSDHFPEFCGGDGGSGAPTADKPAQVAVAVQFNAPPEVDAIYARAMEAGCTSVSAPEDTFWNARFAALADPFGHRWMLNAPLPA